MRRIVKRTNDGVSDDRQRKNTMQPAHQSNIESHITVQDMTEFVSDDPLQFVACECHQRTTSDSDHRILRRRAGGKSVDPLFVFQQIDGRNGYPRGQCHLFNNVQENSFGVVLRVRWNLAAT